MASSVLKSLMRFSSSRNTSRRSFSLVTSQIGNHTAKWMQEMDYSPFRSIPKGEHGADTSKKSPMELINEVPPIKVEGRIVACEGDTNPALGHPIEYICLDLAEPAICKYCGLRSSPLGLLSASILELASMTGISDVGLHLTGGAASLIDLFYISNA
ncbi:NADH dehydrogenase [ubiquinone] iron-sulfur protein 6, mitochondrial [Mucuna pruriens]|uniref:NADH dehydrogenase [ubiquinone] iron-sulfur protein 6, mitochondrial n=1 Tax=Mucuna pruriens TaxID=157652 RepID=A0A371H5X0_MUCPR|nr:NADH dehydrogenase [ubiquinone] iron-sulfur protein 6, mitochondrial [Mucuna pruriens]